MHRIVQNPNAFGCVLEHLSDGSNTSTFFRMLCISKELRQQICHSAVFNTIVREQFLFEWSVGLRAEIANPQEPSGSSCIWFLRVSWELDRRLWRPAQNRIRPWLDLMTAGAPWENLSTLDGIDM